MPTTCRSTQSRFHPMAQRLCLHVAKTPKERSKSGIQVRRRCPNHLSLAKTDASCASLSFSASLNEIGSINTGSFVNSVDFSPDGTRIVSGLSSGTIKVWELRDQPVGERELLASKEDQAAIDEAYDNGCSPISINGVAVASWEEFDKKLEETEGDVTIKVWDSGAKPPKSTIP
eukprot:1166417-Prymnesium_polylepis.1